MGRGVRPDGPSLLGPGLSGRQRPSGQEQLLRDQEREERGGCLIHAKALEQKILHRLHEPDEEMEAALDHLRLHYWDPYTASREYRADPSKLEGWRKAEKPSQEWRKGFYFEQALRLLGTALYNT